MWFVKARKATGWMVLDVDGGQVAQPGQTSYEEVSRPEPRPDLGSDRTLPGRLVLRCGIAVGLTSKLLAALVVAAALFTTGCGSSASPADLAAVPDPADIGPAGGTFTVSAASNPIVGSTIVVPPGALTERATFTFEQGTAVSLVHHQAFGPSVLAGPANVTLALPVTVTVPVAPPFPLGATIDNLVVLVRDETTSAVTSLIPVSRDAVAGTLTVSVSSLGTFAAAVVLPVSAALSTVSAAPSTLIADGTRTTVITVTAKDTAGAVYAGKSVVLSASGAGSAITQPAATTGVNGETTGAVASTQVGQKTVTATVDGVLLNQQATVSFIPVLAISPANPTLFTDWLTFSASGGSAAGYTWAFVTNSSGGSINPTSGRYVPGVTTGVTDVIKVTDSLGNTVTVSITIPPPTFFVSKGGLRTVVKLDASGTVVGANPFATLASSMDYGTAAVDLNGNLYFPTLGAGTIERVTPGGVVSLFATTGGLLEGAARNPLTGDILATNFTGNNLKRIGAAGAVTDVSAAGLANPVGIVFDLEGNYYVTSFSGASVRAFKPDGTALTTWGTNGVVTTPAGATAGIAFDPRGGNFYVSCQNVGRVYRINSTGTTVTLFWTAPSGQTNGLAVGDGSLYVADRAGGVVNRVDLVTATATLFATIANATGITRIP